MSTIIDTLFRRSRVVEHKPSYEILQNDCSVITCSCGWKSPAIDTTKNFTLGNRQRDPDSYFEEHKALAEREVETGMLEPAREQAVTPAHKPKAKKHVR